MLRKELYRSGDSVVYSEPDRKKRYPTIRSSNRSPIGGVNDNPDNYFADDDDGKAQVVTSDGYSSGGHRPENIKPRMASWGEKRNIGASITEIEERRKVKEVYDDFAQHSKSLRESPSTYIVAYSDSTEQL
jgi:hypothetical protein